MHAKVDRELGGETRTQADELTGAFPDSTPEVPVILLALHPAAPLIGRRYPLAEGERLTLGRGCDALGRAGLDLNRISRRHALLHCRRGEVWLSDLGSRNGSFLNGQRVGEPRRLEAGDVVGLGPVLLLFDRGPVTSPPHAGGALVGPSTGLALVRRAIERLAEDSVPVLISGETGVGKELVAEELHRQSSRRGELVALNCAAVADGVVHSELFGHVRGAFSGAETARVGLLGRAAGGTLLLDEIGDASPPFQATLLRLLEQHTYRQVGSDEVRTSDARIVAATHRPLGEDVAQGRFRADLYARLERSHIAVPPLRTRLEDVVPLALHFARRQRGEPVALSRTLALALLRYRWPRNVRELGAVVEQAGRETAPGEPLRLSAALRQRLRRDHGPGEQSATAAEQQPPAGGASDVSRPTRPNAEQLTATLRQSGGNVSAAAERLGVTRRTIYRWADELGVDLQAVRRGEA